MYLIKVELIKYGLEKDYEFIFFPDGEVDHGYLLYVFNFFYNEILLKIDNIFESDKFKIADEVYQSLLNAAIYEELLHKPTNFKQLLEDCHLSIPRAAALLDVRADSVRKWCNGKSDVPQGVIEDLIKLKKAVKGIFNE